MRLEYQVPHLDSSALGMLLLLHNGAAGQNKSVELINCSEAVMEILEAAKLTKTFTIR